MESMIPNKLDQRATKAALNRPDIQTAFYGLNTSSSPYLLVQHSPYLLNMKFHDSGQGLNRRDGHKVYKRFPGEKIVDAVKAINGDIYYMTRNISTGAVTLRNIIRTKETQKEYSIDISSLVTMNDTDKIDNFDIIAGFVSSSFNVFPYFNLVHKDGTRIKYSLQTDKQLSSIDVNKLIKIGTTSSTPVPIVAHSYFNEKLFIISEDTSDQYKLHWGDKNSLSLTYKIDMPNDDEVYAMKAFSDSVFIFCENRVYKVSFDEKEKTASIQVNSESYGVTSNKLIKTIGSTIYYWGASSGLASMMGSSADSILDAVSQQRPADYYISNFHKIFKAKKMCYKKDDKSIYVIGSLKCDFITEAIHWQEVYAPSGNQIDYDTSLANFRSSVQDNDRFILEYNVAMQRFSLHYYDKNILGHFNFRLNIPTLDTDQSSELIFTEDYIATTSSDFITDDVKAFPVQICSIPRSHGLFEGFITSDFITNIKFCTNKEIVKDRFVDHVPCDLPTSIVNDTYSMYIEDTDSNPVEERVSLLLEVRKSHSDRNPCLLVGFSSESIRIFEGFQVNSNMTAKNTS